MLHKHNTNIFKTTYNKPLLNYKTHIMQFLYLYVHFVLADAYEAKSLSHNNKSLKPLQRDFFCR